MNQINLDKLLQLAPSGKADTAALKLVVAQVYQGQIQQLSGGGFSLQVPSAQGALQITLPASANITLQQLVQQASPEAIKTGQLAALQTNLPPRLPVQVQFQPLANGNIELNIQTVAKAITLNIPPEQLRQLLLAAYSAKTATTPMRSADSSISALLVTAKIPLTANNTLIQLPALAPLALSGKAQANLAQWLGVSQSSQFTVALQLKTSDKGVEPNVLQPTSQGQQPGTAMLDKPQQQALLQQLIKVFNQQPVNTAGSNHPILNAVKQLGIAPPGAYQLQLQANSSGSLAQLQLLPQKDQLQLAVLPEDSNRPLQFISRTAQNTPTTTAGAASGFLSAVTVQQAWRHLLPLLPQKGDLLTALPELPEQVQQILQLVRQSQPDGSKVLTLNQLAPQLQSLLQFQPLQNNANVQTSGGTLAVAIQLLLGHLLQKPLSAAQQPANQKLLQLVNSLEPNQTSNLLRQLAGHSGTLQQSQLATLDSSQSAQQHLLLQLPLQQGEHSVFSQIQLEQREADGKVKGEKQTQWQLTMRFDLQQLGPLLVVAKLQQQQLQLQFYTEQTETKQLADKFLPLLKERCNMQGLVVSDADCVLGKIPDTLLPRANSLLAVKV